MRMARSNASLGVFVSCNNSFWISKSRMCAVKMSRINVDSSVPNWQCWASSLNAHRNCSKFSSVFCFLVKKQIAVKC